MGVKSLWRKLTGGRWLPAPDAANSKLLPASASASASASADVEGVIFDSDQPQIISQADPLRRAKWVEAFENQLRLIPIADSFVFSLEGPWGTGKTSVLDTIESNLTKQGFLVLRFNPWLFAGTHDLVGNFFLELAAQLKDKESRFKELSQVLGGLSNLLDTISIATASPTLIAIKGILKGSSEALGHVAELRQVPSLLQAKRRLTQQLANAKLRLLVLVDDLERLTAREALEVLRAVRAIADLPGLIYVLAFDRDQLLKSLKKEGEDPSLLDKIIQAP